MAERQHRRFEKRDTRGLRILPHVRNQRIRELRAAGLLESDPITGITPTDVFPELLENAMGYLRWSRSKVGELTEDQFWLEDPRTGEKVPCAEFELEQRLATSAKALAETIVRLDLDTRALKVEQGKLDILSRAIASAADAAGLNEGQRRVLGKELRTQLLLLESGEPSSNGSG